MSVLRPFLAIFGQLHEFAFCFIMFEPIKIETYLVPQNDRLNLSLVKDIYVVGKKMARNGRKTDI